MRAYFIFTSLALLIFGACKEDSGSPDEPNEVLTFAVEGMVCEKGCGATIRKELYSLNGVSSVKVSFEEGKVFNEIEVFVNRNFVTEKEVSNLIENINDKQFTVKFIGSKMLTDKDIASSLSDPGSRSAGNTHDSGVNASSRSFSFPNLTELLNGLIH
ncbi:MAG: heavy metal-associated domain-containing protein [Brumimicrobium sp.]|nr:heavy metal-associated domain-containing protein [Brumimicrobium sp.]